MDKPALSEMSNDDLNFMDRLLRWKKPKKVLEIGVSAGGTTAFLLDRLPKDATIHSVDWETSYYRKPSLPTGFVAGEMYEAEKHPLWVRHFGTDIALCGEKIGDGVDFLVLDTMHVLPGEVLSFLAAFPLLAEGSVLFLHDMTLHVQDKGLDELPVPYLQEAYSNPLLFNAIHSPEKCLAECDMPNSGAIIIRKDMVENMILMVFNLLFLPWFYIPLDEILDGTASVLARHYPKKIHGYVRASAEI